MRLIILNSFSKTSRQPSSRTQNNLFPIPVLIYMDSLYRRKMRRMYYAEWYMKELGGWKALEESYMRNWGKYKTYCGR